MEATENYTWCYASFERWSTYFCDPCSAEMESQSFNAVIIKTWDVTHYYLPNWRRAMSAILLLFPCSCNERVATIILIKAPIYAESESNALLARSVICGCGCGCGGKSLTWTEQYGNFNLKIHRPTMDIFWSWYLQISSQSSRLLAVQYVIPCYHLSKE